MRFSTSLVKCLVYAFVGSAALSSLAGVASFAFFVDGDVSGFFAVFFAVVFFVSFSRFFESMLVALLLLLIYWVDFAKASLGGPE